ncbi:MAG: class I SAM-dependent methyltransferase [Deltaproteobacteria bacterium]|nr:class I SAM-dependent methyltransferase [Deltaproteobacteria bacterium]
MNERRADGDLTDVQSWERAWRRSPLGEAGSGLRRRMVEDHHDALRACFAAATRHHPGPLQVLEVGCAPGKMLRQMATLEPGHHYSGVDFAPQALAQTERFLRAAGVTPTLHLADVREFTPPQPYDLVTSFGLIEHFDDPQSILEHHVRLVRPGGIVGIGVPNYRHPTLTRALELYSPNTLETHNLDVMTTAALAGLLESVRLEDVTTGSYGGALLPSARAKPGLVGRGMRVVANVWNLTFRALPRSASPWQGFLWACGRRRS